MSHRPAPEGGGQMLGAGLVDEVAMVIAGDRVLHLRDRVRR